MANRLQHVFLARAAKSLLAASGCMLALVKPVDASNLDIDTEFFEIGATAGLLTVEDFTSEVTLGLSTTFKATENFFLQANYFKTDVSQAPIERDSGINRYSDDRAYEHIDLLVGYNIFQGEIFKGKYSGLSSLYVVGGVGGTEFLGESNFTYVAGLGFQTAVTRRWVVKLDYRAYQYSSVLIDENETNVNNSHITLGVSWLL